MIFRSGNMEIYEMTYEGILFKIKADEEKKVFKKSNIEKGPGYVIDSFNLHPAALKRIKLKRWAKKRQYRRTWMTTTRLICLPTTWTVMQRRPRRPKLQPKRKKTQCWTKWVKLESGRYKFETCHTKVSWEFKWKTDDAELHGPHTSQKMLDWQVGNFSFGFVSTLHFFRWVICHLDLSRFHILFSFRSLASSMLAFLSEKLGLRSSGIPRGLTLSSMSSSTHLTSWMWSLLLCWEKNWFKI